MGQEGIHSWFLVISSLLKNLAYNLFKKFSGNNDIDFINKFPKMFLSMQDNETIRLMGIFYTHI